MTAVRNETHHIERGVGHVEPNAEPLLETRELRAVRQLAVPEQVADFLERAVPGEILDPVAAVDENALGTVYFTEAGLCGDDALQSLACARHDPSRSRSVRACVRF